jgi:hypothetical protein
MGGGTGFVEVDMGAAWVKEAPAAARHRRRAQRTVGNSLQWNRIMSQR